MNESETKGLWGVPTSTVDWCESNYAVTSYLAEFFNTASSFVIVAVGLYGYWLHRRIVEPRFLASFAAVGLVGAGSTAFHATLRFELQLLDELPMLYSALIMVHILVENQPQRRFGRWFPLVLIAHGLLVTALTAWTRGSLQFYLFHVSFGSLELFALFRVFQISRRYPAPAQRRVFRVGMGAYLVGILVWFVDLRYCELLASVLPSYGLVNPQLHAVWHVLVATGFYHLLVLLMYDRLVRLGGAPTFQRTAIGIPRVVM